MGLTHIHAYTRLYESANGAYGGFGGGSYLFLFRFVEANGEPIAAVRGSKLFED